MVELPHLPNAETFRFTPPGFSRREAAEALSEVYGVGGAMTALPGERDQNFRVADREDGRSYVLKISSPQESVHAIRFQIRTLGHVARTDPDLPVPRVIPTTDGRLHAAIRDGNDVPHHVRLLSHLPGVPLDSLAPPSCDVMRAAGFFLGRLLRALAGLAPPAEPEFMPWDVMNGLVVAEGFADSYLPAELRDICEPFLERFAARSLPALRALPAQVIHNDFHAGNILCDPGMPCRLTGCIDFGDIVCRPAVMELASAIADFAGAVEDFGAACRAFLAGVRAHVEVEDDLLPLVHDAALARAVLCAQLATFRLAHANTDPDIEAVHLPSAIRAVRTISSIDRAAFRAAMSRAA